MRYFSILFIITIIYLPLHTLTENELYCYMKKVGIKSPKIVLKQAIYETGHFKSKIYKTKNNLFGFRRSVKYMKFETWQASVDYYKKWQDKYYKDEEENYYNFLQKKNYSGYKKFNYAQELKKIKIRDSLTCLEVDSVNSVIDEK